MKKIISKIIRHRIFYKIWVFLNKLSNYGLNFGVASGYANYSGELHIIKKVKSKNEIKPVIFDVGANVGDWSKYLINVYKNESYSLHMFEPVKNAFNILNQNIKYSSNRFFNNIALGDQKGYINIHFDTKAQGSAGAFIEGSISEKVNITTLDQYCLDNSIKKIHFLKMDVQGYEFQILKGAKQLLQSKSINFIQFEIDEPCIENRIFFKDFWKLLCQDYKIYHSLYNGLIEIKEYNFELENFRCMNYLAVLK